MPAPSRRRHNGPPPPHGSATKPPGDFGRMRAMVGGRSGSFSPARPARPVRPTADPAFADGPKGCAETERHAFVDLSLVLPIA